MPGPYEAAVFDCDGLLLDTATAWCTSFDAVARDVGHRLTDGELTALAGSSVSGAATRIASWAGLANGVADLTAHLHRELVHAIRVATPRTLPGVPALLARLAPRLPLAVASNAPHDVLEDMLDRSGLRDSFAVVVSADTVAQPKPAPDVYLSACDLLGVAPAAAVALEDSHAGASAAQAAGLALIVTTDGGWPARTPLAWPAHSRPILFVTSLADTAVAPHILGG